MIETFWFWYWRETELAIEEGLRARERYIETNSPRQITDDIVSLLIARERQTINRKIWTPTVEMITPDGILNAEIAESYLRARK